MDDNKIREHGVGIHDVGTTGNLVQGNYIGTDATGMGAVGNALDGVVICCGGASENTVGGTTPIGRAQFKITLQTPLSNGTFVTTTATDPFNNTSEFCQCVKVDR